MHLREEKTMSYSILILALLVSIFPARAAVSVFF